MYKVVIAKNPDCYTKEHNAYMWELLRNYAGLSMRHFDHETYTVLVGDFNFRMLSHLADCDMIAVISIEEGEESK